MNRALSLVNATHMNLGEKWGGRKGGIWEEAMEGSLIKYIIFDQIYQINFQYFNTISIAKVKQFKQEFLWVGLNISNTEKMGMTWPH